MLDFADTERQIDWISRNWINKNKKWMLNFTQPLHIISYHDLKADIVGTMSRLLHFLQWEVTDCQMQCLTTHIEGSFHRKKTAGSVTLEQFLTNEQLKRMDSYVEEFKAFIHQRLNIGLPLSL